MMYMVLMKILCNLMHYFHRSYVMQDNNVTIYYFRRLQILALDISSFFINYWSIYSKVVDGGWIFTNFTVRYLISGQGSWDQSSSFVQNRIFLYHFVWWHQYILHSSWVSERYKIFHIILLHKMDLYCYLA